MQKDASGNRYIEVNNVRLTYVPASRREAAKNWASQDVIRIQAYRGEEGGALHMGAEFPIGGPHGALRFVEAFCRLCAEAGESRG